MNSLNHDITGFLKFDVRSREVLVRLVKSVKRVMGRFDWAKIRVRFRFIKPCPLKLHQSSHHPPNLYNFISKQMAIHWVALSMFEFVYSTRGWEGGLWGEVCTRLPLHPYIYLPPHSVHTLIVIIHNSSSFYSLMIAFYIYFIHSSLLYYIG